MNKKYDKEKGSYFTLDFSNITETGVKELTTSFNRSKAKVVEVIASNRAGKKNGEAQKKATFIFENGQAVTVWFNAGGNVFQTKLNSTIVPISNQKTVSAYCREIASLMVKNQEKFEKALARKAAGAIKNTSQVKTARKTIDQQINEAQEAFNSANEMLINNKKLITEQQDRYQTKKSELDILIQRNASLIKEEEELSELLETLSEGL